VSSQDLPHPGQTPPVSNVFHRQPQAGSHIQTSAGCGFHWHLGQNTLAWCGTLTGIVVESFRKQPLKMARDGTGRADLDCDSELL